MVVGHLRCVEDALRLGQRFSSERSDQFGIDGLSGELCLEQSVHDLRTLRIDVVGEILRVDTRIGGQFAFVERLYEVERLFGTHPELTVAVHLQRCQVVEHLRLLLAILLLYLLDGERLATDGREGLFALFFRQELPLCRGEECFAVDGGKHPVGLGLEVVYLALPVDDERQCRCLDAPDGEHLSVLPIFQGVESCGIHSEQPVADSP